MKSPFGRDPIQFGIIHIEIVLRDGRRNQSRLLDIAEAFQPFFNDPLLPLVHSGGFLVQ